jgi:hypothetical protein
MARTSATNFAGALQFPYATAGTDIFKKEDVQTLAQAVDQHDHSTGKGLAIGTGTITSAMIADGTIQGADIANGAITTTQIADGTIQNADLGAGVAAANVGTLGGSLTGTLPNPGLAAGSVANAQLVDNTIDQAKLTTGARVRFVGQYWGAANFTTSAIGSWVATPIIQALPNVQTNKSYIISWMVPIQSSLATSNIWLSLGWNGAAQAQVAQFSAPGANYLTTLSGTVELAGANVPTATNVQIYVMANAGTTQISGATWSSLTVREIFSA